MTAFLDVLPGKTKGANPQDIAGKFSVVWVREGGKWKNNTDIWNMNN
jgi:ketosteroid isomerase-like protein